jgi:hypothetical protein
MNVIVVQDHNEEHFRRSIKKHIDEIGEENIHQIFSGMCIEKTVRVCWAFIYVKEDVPKAPGKVSTSKEK